MRRFIAPVAIALLLGIAQLADAPASLSADTPLPEKFGIGAVFVQSDSTQAITVRGCLKDGPAERAGLAAGDTLLEVDGQSIAGWSFTRVLEHLIRDKPLPLNLTIRRGTQTLGVQMTRARMSDIAAGAGFRWEMAPDLSGYMQVPLNEAPVLRVGDPIEFGTLLDAQCKEAQLSRITQPTFVYFWASWCTPCKELMRQIKDHGSSSVRVVGINIDSQCETFHTLTASLQPPGEQAWAGKSSDLAEGFLVHRGIPVGGLVDPNGRLVATALGVNELFTLYKQAAAR